MKPNINIPWLIGIAIYAVYVGIDFILFSQNEFTQSILVQLIFLALPFFLTFTTTYLSKNRPLLWGSSYTIIFPAMWATRYLLLYLGGWLVDIPNIEGSAPIFILLTTLTYFFILVIPTITGAVFGFLCFKEKTNTCNP